MRQRIKQVGGRLVGPELAELRRRVQILEEENVDLRRHSLRAAEILDVVEQLLVPMASRDQDRIDEAIERFHRSL